MFNTPVLFLLFNRPDTTKQVFEVIRQIKPVKLFIAADGPREDREGEVELCRKTREIVLNSIDWDCEVKTLLREDNLGCGKAVSEAISWFFENVDEGIILEDDTIPNKCFFKYCEDALYLFRNDNSVMHIGGTSLINQFIVNHNFDRSNVYFSKNIHVWGWATWKRAWCKYSFFIDSHQLDLKKKELQRYFGNSFAYWYDLFEKVSHDYFTWDYQWMYTIAIQNGHAINPLKNLITNIGFNDNATHTKEVNKLLSYLPTETLDEIKLPINKSINSKFDRLIWRQILGINSQKNVISSTRNIFKKIYKKFVKAKIKPISDFEKINSLCKMPRYKSGFTKIYNIDIKFCDAESLYGSYKEIFIEKIYNFNTNSKRPLFIDCGANIGLATLFLKMNFPNAEIHCFEPDPNLFEALKYNISSFKENDIFCYNNPVSNKIGYVNFLQEGGHSGMIVQESESNVIELQTIRLRNFLEQFPYIDFLKIDIEGHETTVIPDIQDQLHKVKNMFIEYHSFLGHKQELAMLLNILEASGFRYYLKEAYDKRDPFIQREIFLKMDILVNIFCYKE